MTRDDLRLLLDRELPLPDAPDRDSRRYVTARRHDRAAEFGFDRLDVILCARDTKRAQIRGHLL